MKNTRENAQRFLDSEVTRSVWASQHATTSELLVEYGKKVSKDTVTEQQVLEMMRGNRFERWYAKDFVDYIGGQPEAKSKKEILKNLREMLGIKGE